MQLINFEVELEKTTTRASYFHLPAKARFKTLWNSTWKLELERRWCSYIFSLPPHYLFTKEVENALLPPSSSNRCICHLHAAAVDAAAAAVCLLSRYTLLAQRGRFFSPKNAKKICLWTCTGIWIPRIQGLFCKHPLLHYLFVVILIH